MSALHPAVCQYIGDVCLDGFFYYMGRCLKRLVSSAAVDNENVAENVCKDMTFGAGKTTRLLDVRLEPS